MGFCMHHINKSEIFKIMPHRGLFVGMKKIPGRDRLGIIFLKKGGVSGIFNRKLTTFYNSQHNVASSSLFGGILPDQAFYL